MILTQLGIAPVIVTITYAALIGATALATALAFGLGGRDAAAELVNSGYRKAQDQARRSRPTWPPAGTRLRTPRGPGRRPQAAENGQPAPRVIVPDAHRAGAHRH